MSEGAVSTNIEAASVRPTSVVERTKAKHSFDDLFREEFERRHASIFRYIARLSDDPDLAADIAQEAFVRLYQRGEMPDDAGAWLITVASNLLRNQWQGQKRRARVLTIHRGTFAVADPPQRPDAAAETSEIRVNVRAALDTLPVRDRQLLLLRYEGYSYRQLAKALDLAETSVGTLLARAKEAFRRTLSENSCALE